jgi:hypothetical protein
VATTISSASAVPPFEAHHLQGAIIFPADPVHREGREQPDGTRFHQAPQPLAKGATLRQLVGRAAAIGPRQVRAAGRP